MLFYIYLTVSVLADILITVFGDLINAFADIWKPILLFIGLFFICLVIHALMMLVSAIFARKPGKVIAPTRWITIETANLLLKLMRVKVHTKGFDMLPENQRFLLVGNHRTVFEPIACMWYFRKYRLAFVSKKENLEIPVGKNLIMSTGCIPLDRNDDRSAVKTIIQAANIIKSGELSMGIYPEGGTNKTDAPLLPFRNGAFKIAQRAGSPIAVITICGTEIIKKRMFLRKTNVYIDVLKVIPYEEIAGLSTNEIGEAVYKIMLENIEKRSGDTAL